LLTRAFPLFFVLFNRTSTALAVYKQPLQKGDEKRQKGGAETEDRKTEEKTFKRFNFAPQKKAG
jgi:hypothetical protein